MSRARTVINGGIRYTHAQIFIDFTGIVCYSKSRNSGYFSYPICEHLVRAYEPVRFMFDVLERMVDIFSVPDHRKGSYIGRRQKNDALCSSKHIIMWLGTSRFIRMRLASMHLRMKETIN